MPTPAKIVGDDGASYQFGIDTATIIAFLNVDAQGLAHGAQKNEILNQLGNVIAVGFSRDGELAISFSGLLKGTAPLPGDTLTVQVAEGSGDITGVVSEDIKVDETNTDWKKCSFTLMYYPDMTITP